MHKGSFPSPGRRMLAAFAFLAAASVVAGCRGEQAQPASVTAAANTGPVARSKQQAMADLMALPELKAWSSQLEKASRGAVHGALIEYDPTPKVVAGKSYWQFSFVENGSDAAHRWESFLVAYSGKEILVEDFATDKTMTLEQWRKEKRPMERTGAEPNGD